MDVIHRDYVDIPSDVGTQSSILALALAMAQANGSIVTMAGSWADDFTTQLGIDADLSENEVWSEGQYEPEATASVARANTLGGTTLSFTGHTIVNRIGSALILATGGEGGVTISIKAQAGAGTTVGKAYIGHKAASGDAYDFETTPVQILFGGSASKALAAGESAVSDKAAFIIESGKDVLVALYITGANHAKQGATADLYTYYKGGDDAATVNKSGYTEDSAANGAVTLESITVHDGFENMTLVSEEFPATEEAIAGLSVFDLDFDGALVPDTDFDFGLSLDGTTWAEGTITLMSELGTQKRYQVSGIDLSGQTGATVRARIRTLTNKAVAVTGWANKTSA